MCSIEEDYVRLVIMISMCLGLRFSEVLALKWLDINWRGQTIYVRRGIVLGRVDETKTEYSEAPAPLDPRLANALLQWRSQTQFTKDEDWVFASPFMAGEKPYFPTAIRRKVHAAGAAVGIDVLL